MASYPYRITGSEYSRTDQGEEATLTYVVSDIGGPAAGRMIAAAENTGLPTFNERHPTRPSLRAVDFRAVPARDQPAIAIVTVRYRSPGLISSTSEADAVQVSMSTEVINEETTEDINGNQMITSYVARATIGAGGSSISRDQQVHRVSVERPTFGVQFERVEDGIAFAKATQFAGKVNSRTWQGRPPKHWLIRISSTPSSDDRHSVRYDAVFNPKSWVAEIRHATGGVQPVGAGVTNGVSFYDVYESIDYNQLGLPRKL